MPWPDRLTPTAVWIVSRAWVVDEVAPRGVDHFLLRVSSLEKSLPYYRMVYGTAAERPRDGNGRYRPR